MAYNSGGHRYSGKKRNVNSKARHSKARHSNKAQYRVIRALKRSGGLQGSLQGSSQHNPTKSTR